MPIVSKRAFTLIELLIVVAIIAILAAIAVPNFLEAQTRAKVTRTRADMRTIATGIESYRVDNNAYPPQSDYPRRALVPSGGATAVFDAGFHSRTPSWLTTPVAHITSTYKDIFIPTTTVS